MLIDTSIQGRSRLGKQIGASAEEQLEASKMSAAGVFGYRQGVACVHARADEDANGVGPSRIAAKKTANRRLSLPACCRRSGRLPMTRAWRLTRAESLTVSADAIEGAAPATRLVDGPKPSEQRPP